MTDDQKLHDYIHSLPGPVWGQTIEEPLTKVKQAAGITCDLGALKAALWRYGWIVSKVGARYVLTFPEGPARPLGGE